MGPADSDDALSLLQFNISRDDILSYPTKTHNDNPKVRAATLASVRKRESGPLILFSQPVIDALDSVRTFTDSARAVTMCVGLLSHSRASAHVSMPLLLPRTLLEHLERNLQLPAGAFTSLHQEGSGFGSPSKARVIRNPPQNESTKLSLGVSNDDLGDDLTLLTDFPSLF